MKTAPTAPRTRRRSPALAALGGGLTLLAAVMLWLLFAPQSFGGQFDYATVVGNSMAPGLKHGDAVLIRREPEYHVGDAVAARTPKLGVVLHRIIADDGVRFTLQGDNRTARDAYEPTRGDILGKQWARIPRAGSVIRWLRSPIGAVVLGAAVLGLLAVGATKRAPRGRGAKRGTPARERSDGVSLAQRLALQSPSGQTLAGSLLLLVLASVVIAVVHYQLTDQERVTRTLAFTESGRFNYGDNVPGGVYDNNRLGAPDPVYLSLVDELPVSFDYQLAPLTPGEQLRDVVGAYQLAAEVSHPNGWTTTIPLGSPTLFAGQAARAEGVVNLDEVMATITNAEDQTGVKSLFYTLRIVATVSADGSFGGVPFSRAIDSAIQFRLSVEQLQFDVQESALESSANITVGRPELLPRVLEVPLAGIKLPFRWFPTIALAGLATAALGYVAIVIATRAVARMGPAAAIRARYGHLLVSVADDGSAYDGAELDDLLRRDLHAAESLPRAAAKKRSSRRRARARRLPSARPAPPEGVPAERSEPPPFTAITHARRAPTPTASAPAAPIASPPPQAAPTPPPAAVPPPALSPRATPAPATRPLRRDRNVIVESFDDLARLAEQRGLAVLTTHHGDIDEYAVIDDDVTYHFAALAPRSRTAPDAAPQPKHNHDDDERRRFRLAG